MSVRGPCRVRGAIAEKDTDAPIANKKRIYFSHVRTRIPRGFPCAHYKKKESRVLWQRNHRDTAPHTAFCEKTRLWKAKAGQASDDHLQLARVLDDLLGQLRGRDGCLLGVVLLTAETVVVVRPQDPAALLGVVGHLLGRVEE